MSIKYTPLKKKRILLIASEIAPFLTQGSMAPFTNSLIGSLVKSGAEVRVFMPLFGIIKENRHHIHEVIRLSGINIPMEGEYISVLIKVGPIKHYRVQVYFVDNEEFFQRKTMWKDEEGRYYNDNHKRSVFFCKSVLSAIRTLEWTPDIVHSHGWFSSFVPLYLKTTYKNSPLFKHSQAIHTHYSDNLFNQQVNPTPEEIYKIIKLREVKEKHLSFFKAFNQDSLNSIAKKYADEIIEYQPINKEEESGKEEQEIKRQLQTYSQLLEKKN